ncbi:MAG: Crp/Fnr family transcriptional regulator [Oscillospiraceae bacterium]|nr:Crp/Fnr family transcriptional regulator [Oscillospiraceae bacterium]
MNYDGLTESLTAILRGTKLFTGISEAETERFLNNAGAHKERYRKNDLIICEGDENNRIGVILSGSIVAERVYPDGEVATASKMGAGGVIGDVLSGSSAVSPVTVIAAEESVLLFFFLSAFIEPNARIQDIQLKLTRNLILDISDKYFELEKRIAVMSARTLRRKILLYLCGVCRDNPGEFFSVEHSREQQAAYLGCERTALSRELAKMKEDGVIDYNKNRFMLMPSALVFRGDM